MEQRRQRFSIPGSAARVMGLVGIGRPIDNAAGQPLYWQAELVRGRCRKSQSQAPIPWTLPAAKSFRTAQGAGWARCFH